ncbi:MAG: hypothetical protein PUF65_05300 [Lachnospiraceae bacterium]|nr:hypothetical protein [Lachnospiraceae bacterium]
MKKGKRIIVMMMVLTMIFAAGNLNPVYGETTNSTQLSKTKVTLEQGKTKTISLLNNSEEVKWTTSDKRIVKIVSSSKEKVKIKAVKKGTAYVKAKVGTRTYKCKVTVTKKKQLTVDEAWEKLYKWFDEHNIDATGKKTMYVGKDGDGYLFQFYEDMGDHTATINFYTVNCKTGKITAMF